MKVMQQTGESAIIHWIAPYFPSADTYHIHKSIRSEKTYIMKIEKNKIFESIPSKYTYLSTPLNSTNITFEIRNITHEDAGYYAGDGTDGGVVLIVLGEVFFRFLFLIFGLLYWLEVEM